MKLSLRAWTGIIVLGVGVLIGLIAFARMGRTPPEAQAQEGKPAATVLPVKVIHPQKGIERISSQPGSIQAYESVRLYAKVPGFLKWQKVDIGDRVGVGEKLAVVDVPEIETQVERTRAIHKQAQKRVKQMEARVRSAKADLEATQAAVTQAEATQKSSAAWVRFRSKQLQRMTDLFVLKSIEERLVDESKERYEASIETELAAQASILTSKARVAAAASKVEIAEADVSVAEAEVDVAKAGLDKYKTQLGFATITAPFDGVVTQRASFVGDFVRSANEGPSQEPLLTVQRTDKMRVVVQLPDRDVPFADPGDPAEIEIDALGDSKVAGKISRIAKAEDAQTRVMRIEIDVPNPKGNICHGMYGKVIITLNKSPDQLSIPSACLVGRAGNGKGAVYVVRDGHAHLVSLRLGIDNGIRVGVLSGLALDDSVILQPGNTLTEGSNVNPTEADSPVR
jgi:RND family efflux transporter MFP subunit